MKYGEEKKAGSALPASRKKNIKNQYLMMENESEEELSQNKETKKNKQGD